MTLEILLLFLSRLSILLLAILIWGIVYARWNYGNLEHVKGLPVVIKPWVVGGSEPAVHKVIVHEQDDKNVKKYGKIYGKYEGREAQIYIADVDVVREILIKDFSHFQNKRIIDFGHELINEMMDLLPYKKWKPVRSFLSPALSTGKLRYMSQAMSEAIEDWLQVVKQDVIENGIPFEPKRMFRALTSDVVARCGFGTKLNSLHDPKNMLVQNMNKVFHEDKERNFLLPLIHTFPFLMKILPVIPPEALDYFCGLVGNTMEARRKNNVKMNDFVDTLNEFMDCVDTSPEFKAAKVTKKTVMSQAMLFFVASFKTTTAALTFLAYNLATNPISQDKLLEEIDAYLNRNHGKIEHATLNELVYLTACMNESLRLHPPIIRVERVCTNDWVHENTGLRVPKGMAIQVPVWSVNHNEEYFENAEEFQPERFLPENKEKMNPYAFLSFGLGPHNCVGMRFAKELILLTMTHFLKDFKLLSTSDTRLTLYKGSTFLLAAKPFTMKVVKRK